MGMTLREAILKASPNDTLYVGVVNGSGWVEIGDIDYILKMVPVRDSEYISNSERRKQFLLSKGKTPRHKAVTAIQAYIDSYIPILDRKLVEVRALEHGTAFLVYGMERGAFWDIYDAHPELKKPELKITDDGVRALQYAVIERAAIDYAKGRTKSCTVKTKSGDVVVLSRNAAEALRFLTNDADFGFYGTSPNGSDLVDAIDRAITSGDKVRMNSIKQHS